MKNNVIMWTENNNTERLKLQSALASATEPIQKAMKYFEWEGVYLTCGGNCPKEHWRNMYFYLSGYGDCLFLSGLKEMVCVPQIIPVPPATGKTLCEVFASEKK